MGAIRCLDKLRGVSDKQSVVNQDKRVVLKEMKNGYARDEDCR